MYCDVAGSIDVFRDPGRSIPIGTARCIGWDAAGSAVWRLVTHDEDSEGPCLIVDREFLSTRPDWRHLYRNDHRRDYDRSGPASRPLTVRRRRSATIGSPRSGVQPTIS